MENLAEVCSSSGDTIEFAANLRHFLNDNIPGFVWILFGVCMIIYGLVSIFVAAFNYSKCYAEQKIPLYLVLSGIALIVNGSVWLCGNVMSSTPKAGARGRSKSSNAFGMPQYCRIATEGAFLLILVIIVILGCVWVYGARYVQSYYSSNSYSNYGFGGGYNDYRMCDYSLYSFAWWSVTGHLVIFGLVILALITVLIFGAMTTK